MQVLHRACIARCAAPANKLTKQRMPFCRLIYPCPHVCACVRAAICPLHYAFHPARENWTHSPRYSVASLLHRISHLFLGKRPVQRRQPWQVVQPPVAHVLQRQRGGCSMKGASPVEVGLRAGGLVGGLARANVFGLVRETVIGQVTNTSRQLARQPNWLPPTQSAQTLGDNMHTALVHSSPNPPTCSQA